MGYDLHMVRTNHWLDATEDPITKDQVDLIIEKDKELAWSQKDYVDMKDDDGKVTRYFAINWKTAPCFWWYKDQIKCSNTSGEQTIKMIQMSKIIGAKVIGDDGEIYDVKKNMFGKLSIITYQPNA